jgi:hypothetical protein
MTGKAEMNGVGLTLNDLFSGTVTFVPCLVAGAEIVTATTPIVFGAGEGEGLINALDGGGDGTLADGETIGVWLVAEVTGPDGVPVTVERTLLDRVGFTVRATGVVDLAGLPPLEFITGLNGEQTVPELAGLTLITVDVARLPSLYAMRDVQSADLFGQLHLFGPSYASLRSSLAFEHLLAAGFDSYPSGPNLTSFSVRLVDPAVEESGLEIATDLLIQHPSIVSIGDGASDSSVVSPYIVSGVLNQVAEQVLLEQLVDTSSDSGSNMVRPTVGIIFQKAEEAGVEITAISTVDELAQLTHSDEVLARIQAALDLGMIVVVPEAPVTVDGADVSGWWLIDPATGQIRDQVEDGRGYAGGRVNPGHFLVSAQAVGYGRLLANVRAWAAPYAALGRCLGIVVAAAVNASDYTSTGNVVNSAIETFKNVNPADAKGCF